MSDSGIERLRRNETRIITQGGPELGLFVVASFRVWNVTNPQVPGETQRIALTVTQFAAAEVADNVVWLVDGQDNGLGSLVAVSVAKAAPRRLGSVIITN